MVANLPSVKRENNLKHIGLLASMRRENTIQTMERHSYLKKKLPKTKSIPRPTKKKEKIEISISLLLLL